MQYDIVKRLPSNSEFNGLSESVGWGKRECEVINQMRKASCFAVSVYNSCDKIIVTGRIVGDGIFYTIFDVIALPEFQGKGIGTIIMNELIKWFKSLPNEPMLYLGASKGKEKFYEKLGFRPRPNEDVGAGMKYYGK